MNTQGKTQFCPQCRTELVCSANENCWCMALTPVLPVAGAQGDCLCATCLAQAAGEGVDYTVENGLLVFTRDYHFRRGYCCGNGCVHCPYKD